MFGKALEHHAQRLGIDGTVVEIEAGRRFRLKRRPPDPPPQVSLIIPTRDRVDVLSCCISSILERTTYQHFEIIIVDNGSVESATLQYFESLQGLASARIIASPGKFNYSALINLGARHAKGSILGILDSDVEVISPEWLEEMVSHASRPEIGCVGAKLYYPDNTIQHAGIILGIGGVAGHAHKYLKRSDTGYFDRLAVLQQLSAVTAACMVVRTSVYRESGGMDEVNLPIAFNDVDLCLRIGRLGYHNLWTPFAELYHHESYSRGLDTNPEHLDRFQSEYRYMQHTWKEQLSCDPYYSPHLSRSIEDFSIAQ
jgi:GT2 family glycosyltransferase